MTRDPNIYKEYCDYNLREWKNDVMSLERFDHLISSMSAHGDTKENNIVLEDDNLIFDGQHRCCWLLFSKGPDYVINALRIINYTPNVLSKFLNSLQYGVAATYRSIRKYLAAS